MHLWRNVERVRDVVRASASGALRGKGRAESFSGRSWERLQQRVDVGLRAQGAGGKKLLPRQVTTLLEGEHGGDKPRGGLAMWPCDELPLAIDQEVFRSSPKLILEAALFPKGKAFDHLSCPRPNPGALAPAGAPTVPLPCSGHALPTLHISGDRAQATARGNVKQADPLREVGRQVQRGKRHMEGQGASGLIQGGARVLVSDVLHEPLDALKLFARALAVPVGAVVEARHRSSNSRLHSSDARTCERVTVHQLDGRRRLRNRRGSRRWRTATVGWSGKQPRTETATQWVRCRVVRQQVRASQRTNWRERGLRRRGVRVQRCRAA